MNALTPITGGARALSPAEVSLVQKTVAKDCNTDEFNLFMAAAASYGLDPLRKQIMPLVFNKDARDQSKRRMSIVIGVDGYRIIASRCGNYRPAEEPAVYEYSEGAKGPTNPLGLVKATVYLWTQDKEGRWFKVAGEAYWDEFVPAKTVWVNDPSGETWPDGNPKKVPHPEGKRTLDPDSNWYRMGRVMLAKCATNQALRAGWPEQYAGLYGEEEMDKARVVDADAAAIAAHFEEERRLELVNGRGTIPMVFKAGGKVEFVEDMKFADRVLAYLHSEVASARELDDFMERNQNGFRLFWAYNTSDALALKKAVEERRPQLAKETVDA